MITQRAFIIGVVGVCFYIIALVNQLPSYYSILTWLAITVLVSCAGVALLSLQGVGCNWRILRSKATASLVSEPQDSLDEDRVLDVGGQHSNAFAARLEAMQREARASEANEQGIDGGGPMLEIELANRGTLNKTGVLVDVRLRHLSRALALTRRFMIESLPSGTSLTSTLTLRGLPRGRYEIVEITLVGSDVLGLFRSRKRVYSNNKAQAAMRAQQIERAGATAKTSWRFYFSLAIFGVTAMLVGDFASRFTRLGGVAAQIGGALSALVGAVGLWTRFNARTILARVRPEKDAGDASQQLVVGPATAFARSLPEASTADLAGHEASRVNALGRGDEMRGTRPYVAGDDLRTVHWKSTARLGQLVVREFHRPARSQSVVIWDGAQTSSTRSDDERDDDIELCLSLAASVCRGWVERGLSCTLLRLDSRPRVVKSVLGANGSALAPFVDALADADNVRETPLLEAIGAHLNLLPSSGDLFVVTSRDIVGELPDDLARVVNSLRRRGTRVCVVGVARAAKIPPLKRGLRDVLKRSQNAPFEIVSRLDAGGARVVSLVRNRADVSTAAELNALLNALLKSERAASGSSNQSASVSTNGSSPSNGVATSNTQSSATQSSTRNGAKGKNLSNNVVTSLNGT